MRKYMLFCAILVLSLILIGCGNAHECSQPCGDCGLCLNESCTETPCTEKCPGHHVCTQPCEECGLCLNESCTEVPCAEKCPGHHVCMQPCEECGLCLNGSCTEAPCAEKCPGHITQPYPFYPAGYVTDQDVSLDMGRLVFDVGSNVWVPGHAQAAAAAMTDAMEAVSGLSFQGTGTYANNFPDGKIHASFNRDLLYVNESWYQGDPNSEIGGAYASAFSHASLSPGDLYITGSAALVHELGHVLAKRQTEWSPCQLLNEGFAEYTSYRTCVQLAQTHPELGFYIGDPQQNLLDMSITDHDQLYAQPVEYWFENTFEYSSNANYAIGFRFMAYLEDVYGSYSRWILKLEELYNFQTYCTDTDIPPVSYQIDAVKAAYGEDVLDQFYPWLRDHEKDFVSTLDDQPRDLQAVAAINLYPCFSAIGADAEIAFFTYQDLFINLEPARQYLSRYKGLDIFGLTLEVSAPTQMELYSEDGTCTVVLVQDSLPLEGIICIRLTGEGTLQYLKLSGFDSLS